VDTLGASIVTILVADDNGENRALAQATLEDAGYRVIFARDGVETVAATAAHLPACILMDIRMPKLSGIEACRAIREAPGGEAIAILFVTAQRDVDTFDRALAVGGDDFITKPYRPDELIVRVQTALRLRRSTIERDALAVQMKEQRDRLQRLELQKEQLVAFLVHDLKNPVHAIDLDARAIRRNAHDPVRVEIAAARIHDESQALLGMITNLLDISKADEGGLAPVSQRLDAEGLVRGAVAELAPRAASAGIALEVAATHVELVGDADLLARVIANLVDNAIRHSPEGAAVSIAVIDDATAIEIRVRDAGPGVPTDQRAAIFERFARGDTHGTRSNRGLGLAFCKIAVEAHGGRIWVEDGGPGAVFCVSIPR